MEKLEKFTLYVGLCDKDSRKQEVSTDYAKDLIHTVVGDCTISDATGYYTHMVDGVEVKEPSLRVELLFKKQADVFEGCKTIKKLLNQESISFNREVIESTLV